MIRDVIWKLKLTFNKLVIFLLWVSTACNFFIYSWIINDYRDLALSACFVLLALIQVMDNRKDRQTLGAVLATGCATTSLTVYYIINLDNLMLGIIYIVELVLIIVLSQIAKDRLYPEDRLR